MDKSYDDLLAISSLVLNLNQRVNDSAEYISKLQGLSKEILPHKEKTDKSSDLTELANSQHQSDTNTDHETSIIRKLEEERITLVMDIQKQDFISEKLLELIDQNQEMLESVKEYLHARESIRIEEDIYTKKDIERFVGYVVRPTRDQLRENDHTLRAKLGIISEKLINIEQEIQKEPSLLRSEKYSNEVKYLVHAFKQLVKENTNNTN